MPRSAAKVQYVVQVGEPKWGRYLAWDDGLEYRGGVFPTVGLSDVDAADVYRTKGQAEEAIELLRDDEECDNYERQMNGLKARAPIALRIRKLVTTVKVV